VKLLALIASWCTFKFGHHIGLIRINRRISKGDWTTASSEVFTIGTRTLSSIATSKDECAVRIRARRLDLLSTSRCRISPMSADLGPPFRLSALLTGGSKYVLGKSRVRGQMQTQSQEKRLKARQRVFAFVVFFARDKLARESRG
jgi:hypothetical protein